MIRLRDIMSTEVLTLDSGATLREAAELLAGEHISGAPVVDGEDVVGVVSATDLLEFESSTPGAPVAREAGPGWPDPEETPPEWTDDEAGDTLYFAEMWADAGLDVLERFRQTDRPEWNVMEEHTVAEAMTRSVHSLPPDTAAEDAARYLLDHDVHRVLVVADGALLGVVSSTDLVRAVAEHGLGA